MTLGVRGVVENSNGEVLLVRHTYTKGLFFPGGGVERGETTDFSLRRELEEEGGVRVTGSPGLIGVFSNHRVFRNDHVVLYRLGPKTGPKVVTQSAGRSLNLSGVIRTTRPRMPPPARSAV